MQTRKEISLLDNKLQEILRSIKKECLSMATIPYNGVVNRIDTKDATIIIHSLIPIIPEEIIKSTAYLEGSSSNELNNLYEIFAIKVAELRKAKKEYALYEMKTSNVTLERKKTI